MNIPVSMPEGSPQYEHLLDLLKDKFETLPKTACRSRAILQCGDGASATNLGFAGIVAGTFDHLELEKLIDRYIGKEGSHVKVNNGAIAKALVVQMLSAPYQSLYGTTEFYAKMPVDALLNKDVSARDLNREVLSRFLDDVAEYGPDRLFIEAAGQTFKKLGITVTEGHLDSTSFSYDGKPKSEDMCELEIQRGYSRDHHPENPQVCLLGMTDGVSRIPFFTTAVSGNVNDKTSFLKVVSKQWPLLQAQFKDLKYLVGDSAMFTDKIIPEAVDKGIHLVTRVPDTYDFAKAIYEETNEGNLIKIYDDEEDLNYGRWCDSVEIGGVPLKLLLVKNYERRESKEDTVRRKAEKELEKTSAAFKKLRTQPAKCRADAEKALADLQKKCKACVISDITYEEVQKYEGKGRPSPDAQKKTIAVKVLGKVSVNEEYIKQKVEEELQFVIATTDTRRNWSMAELLSTYKRQSTIERMWKISKDPKILLNALYLKTPHRIQALMWVLSIALLVYAATEYLLKKAAKENNIKMPAPDHRFTLAVPTLNRLKQYADNSQVILVFLDASQTFMISGMTDVFADIIVALGDEWIRYYQPRTYQNFYYELLDKMNRELKAIA